ncbi:MAG TPA: FapA family protein [Accumulibacter sp.]|nr:hypothetical protein [Accumulibacter sp.]HMW17314.1 FapA family protein [Accumulibacter sp.]HMX21714.1 FapA family protein [Accumulibacter sp.]HMY07113.1 FapA family protein [Accumulibacter sp.]HNC17513.1 FapA family protein [Accumulibacter sp.]
MNLPASAIGSLAELQPGQIVLPRFVVQHPPGLFVKPALLVKPDEFPEFVDRVFAGGLYFRDLVYPTLLSLLYDDTFRQRATADEEVFLAADIVVFRPERQALYKALRFEAQQAEYLFQPVFIDEPDEQGRGGEKQTFLEVDEFIASAWVNGIRFGIDLAALQKGIAAEKAVRLVVAQPQPFVPGQDAELKELAPGLHRNNAPRRLSGGKLDLRSFETCYPQVTAELRLAKKVPMTPGIDGRDILGQPLPAPAPKDFALSSIAGSGTRVSIEPDGEYLLACAAGFLVTDTKTHQFSVSEKIVSHEGVSARTTGDLSLNVENYEQHGEIQEKRIVHCRSITAYGAVCGEIVSTGGLVLLKSNLVGGSASNAAGDIVVEGIASGATLTALAGTVKLRQADNCLIRAQQVSIEKAINCDIVAEQVTIDLAEGCAIAGQSITVRLARSRRELDNVVLVCLPDLSAYRTRIGALQNKQAELTQALTALRTKLATLRNEKEVANYLRLAGQLRRNERVLTAEQEPGWQRLAAKMAPVLRGMAALNERIKLHENETLELTSQIAEVSRQSEAACLGIHCTVEQSQGDTRIDSYLPSAAQEALQTLSAKELKVRLRRSDAATQRLFAGSGQNFTWTYRPPISEG